MGKYLLRVGSIWLEWWKIRRIEKVGSDRKMRGWKIFSFLLYVFGWKDEKVER